ncbi:abortive infection family protein [Rothia uropygialis]|uniref:abortive infection family protein n=1 Tax=Kocuria sp. 36 TaxID=1415402 RepID=UPI0013EA6212|nr:abortive infection family protein [Kocuria sp. 36]
MGILYPASYATARRRADRHAAARDQRALRRPGRRARSAAGARERRESSARANAPVPRDPGPRQRRRAQRLTAVFSDTLQKIIRDTSAGWGNNDALHDKWVRILAEDGFDVEETTGTVRIGRAGARLTEQALNALPDPQSIQDHLHRLADSVDPDPRLAVSTAKALIESTAKCVLTARELTYTRAAKVPALVNAAQDSLGLTPKSVSDEDRALCQALQSLITLTQSVTELRNSVGIDHGAEEVPRWVRSRHARLVVGAAQVWCQLMLETRADPGAPWRR